MSIKIMSAVWDSGLDKNLKAVALAYADFADDSGERIYPSIDRVAWKTGYNRRSVQRITKALCDLGVLRLIKETSGRPGETNRYKFIVENLPKREPYTGDIGDRTGDTVSPVRVTLATGRVTLATETGDTVSPYPPLEPLIESPLGGEERARATPPKTTPQTQLEKYMRQAGLSDLVWPLAFALQEHCEPVQPSNLISQAEVLFGYDATPDEISGLCNGYWSQNGKGERPYPSQVTSYLNRYRQWKVSGGHNTTNGVVMPALKNLKPVIGEF